jgi:serine/threonine protein kinase
MTGVVGTSDFECPEILQHKGFTGKADVWSYGISLYRMLSRGWPFPTDARGPIRGTLKFAGPVWEKISLQCKGFIKKLLAKDPVTRLSATEALADPWLAGITKPVVTSLVESVLDSAAVE